MALEHYTQQHHLRFRARRKLQAHLAAFSSHPVYFLKPTTYMNRSGQAVGAVCNYYDILPQNCLVIHDDSAIAIGAVRVRYGGSSGGHNGVASVSNHIGADYWRVRIGIDTGQSTSTQFVLGTLSADEREHITAAFEFVEEAIDTFINGSIQPTTYK